VSVGAAMGGSLRGAALNARNMRLIGGHASRERRKDDFYPTPPEATRALLGVEQFDGDVLEPACGDGAISRLFAAAGHRVISTDLVDRGYGEAGLDFTSLVYPHRAANVVTNPPFFLAERFLTQALDHSTRKVAMLLKLNFLEGIARSRLLERTPLARIWVFRDRVTFPVPNAKQASKGMFAFAWFVWEHGHAGAPSLGWVSTVPALQQPQLFADVAA
jgi:hypothetical protein